MYNKLEQLEFKLEKIIGIQKHAGKVRKIKAATTKEMMGSPEEEKKTNKR